ncbi:class I lanthipeptide [Maribacter sp. 2-571]
MKDDKKLRLKKTTISNINEKEMEDIKGGYAQSLTLTVTYSWTWTWSYDC